MRRRPAPVPLLWARRGAMLSFGTKKKKKRNWRETVDDDDDVSGSAGASGQGAASEEVIDEKALEAEFLAEEKVREEKERLEQERLGKIQTEAQARKAARKAKWEEQKAAERKKQQEEAAAAGGGLQAVAGESAAGGEAAAAPEESVGGLTDAACREGRCVRVDNVSFQSTEDDVRMLMEGFGRIMHIVKVQGQYGIEYANSLSAEDAVGEQAVGSSKGSVLAGRQLLVTTVTQLSDLQGPRREQKSSVRSESMFGGGFRQPLAFSRGSGGQRTVQSGRIERHENTVRAATQHRATQPVLSTCGLAVAD